MIKLDRNGLKINYIRALDVKVVDKDKLNVNDDVNDDGDSNGSFDGTVAPVEFENHLTKVNSDGKVTYSNTISVVAKEGEEDNVIRHNHPDGIVVSPYIAIESASYSEDAPPATLILKDNTQFAEDTFGTRGGFELKAGNASLNGETNGDLSWNGNVKVDGDLKVESNVSVVIPGEIKWFSGSNIPAGYLICNGATVSRTTYDKLFAAIGTTWGTGDGSTTFTLPNLIDRVAWGASTAGAYKDAGLPNITGSLTAQDEYGLFAPLETKASGAFVRGTVSGQRRGNSGSSTFNPKTISLDASISNAIYGASSTVQPPAATLIPIIKY